ncbi:MAG TPA: peptidylprolyl isomerase [Mycobacterium sp.]
MSTPPPPYGGPLPPYGGYPPPQAGGYPGPQYGYPVGYPRSQATNSLAIVSLVCAFLFAPLGILFGHMSLSEIKKTGEEGRGLAIAGLVIGYLLVLMTVVVVVVGFVSLVVLARTLEDFDNGIGEPGVTAAPAQGIPLPPFDPPGTLGSNCQYPATTEAPSKPVKPPQMGRTPTSPAAVPAGVLTDRGDIGLTLDNEKAPCTVRSFTSLAEQGFFDNTRCHRLIVRTDLRVLQCGDPTATGDGGPGYRFPNEYPSNQYRLTDPAMKTPVVYPRGTLAMANSGPGTNGSQFFLVYGDSVMPPTYTVFGTIDTKGLAVLEKTVAGGVAGGTLDGEPVTAVTIESVNVG